MSAPDTNLQRQKSRHWGALGGIALAVVFAVGALAYYLGYLAATGDNPENADVMIDGRTGEAVQVAD